MPLEGSMILVADENVALVGSASEILASAGAHVVSVGSREEALAAVESVQLDCVLADARIAETKEPFLEELRRSSPGIELVLMAGNAHLNRAAQGVAKGAYGFVLKPLDPVALVRELSKAVRQVRSSRRGEELQEALDRCRTDMEALLRTAHDLFLVLDDEGKVVRANHAVTEATGVPLDELTGICWFDRFVPEEDREEAARAFRGVLAATEPTLHQNRVLRTLSAGGTEARWMRWKAVALRDEQGRRLVYASGLDTSDTRELERRARLTEKLAAVGTLSAGLAHEIRNPLNAAGLQLRLLTRRLQAAEADKALREPVELVQAELGRLSRLVGDFLQFARPTGLVRSRVDLAALTRAVVDLEAPAALEKGAAIDARLPSGPALMDGDSEKLRQVILNLIRNAVEACGRGGRVEVGVEPGADEIQVSVADDGEGIPEADLARIFEPFFSTKPGGTGLGMSIVHSLVGQHGGEVTVRSRQGEGTRVLVSLPIESP